MATAKPASVSISSPKRALLILGMHRSGTSALTRVSNLLGVELGSHLMPPSSGNNETGFWEHNQFVDIHNRLLLHFGLAWDDPAPLPENWWKNTDIQPFRDEIKQLIGAEFQDAPLWGIKDPRLCRLLPLWLDILEELSISPSCLFIVRHPSEVALSLQKRDNFTLEKAYLLWLIYTLESLQFAVHFPKSFIHYDALLADWQRAMEQASADLCFSWPASYSDAAQEVSGFLQNSLRHHRNTSISQSSIPLINEWVETVYTHLSKNSLSDLDSAGLLAEIFASLSRPEFLSFWQHHANLYKSSLEETRYRLGSELVDTRSFLEQVNAVATERHHALEQRAAEIEQLNETLNAQIIQQHMAEMRLEETLASLEEKTAEAEQQKALIAELEGFIHKLLHSTSWRITAPLRWMIVWAKGIYRQLRRRRVDFAFFPSEAITGGPEYGTWKTTDATGDFRLSAPFIPERWVLVSIHMHSAEENFLRPILRVYDGQETHNFSLPLPVNGKIQSILRLPSSIEAISFTPGKNAGTFSLTAIRFWQIGRAEAIGRVLLEKILPALSDYRKLYLIFVHALFILRSSGIKGLKDTINKVTDNTASSKPWNATYWFNAYKPSPALLEEFRQQQWPENAPRFSILMCTYNTHKAWLKEALESIMAQTYPHWELVCVNDASPSLHVKAVLDYYATLDPRIRVVHLPHNRGISGASNIGLSHASGDYVCFMDHDDFLEPQALHRFAVAALSENSDVLYSDEAVTGENIQDIGSIALRTAFSYDYYISHPYFVHFIGVRKAILEEIGGFDESFKVSQDYDLMLRVIEKSSRITHIPDILYRWRTHHTSLGHQLINNVMPSSLRALNNHLLRLGFPAHAREGESFNFFDTVITVPTPAKVAIIIPTKNLGDVLKTCIESIIATTDRALYDIFVIDHQSDDPETQAYLASLAKEHTVSPYAGAFNFSTLMNLGVSIAKKQDSYTHYLLLNNDIEAIDSAWLEHMVNLAKRPDVGVVGAVLLYPDQLHIQHAGVIVGLCGTAEHSHKMEHYTIDGRRNGGFNGALFSTRDYSAVTAACMLMRADCFDSIQGFDEKLAVGFGDTDVCLRAIEAGYKVLLDSHAVLLHHESMSRGTTSKYMLHQEDTALFRKRHETLLQIGDPYYNPLFSTSSTKSELDPSAICSKTILPRTVTVKLPIPL